jgi:hypothetical protein
MKTTPCPITIADFKAILPVHQGWAQSSSGSWLWFELGLPTCRVMVFTGINAHTKKSDDLGQNSIRLHVRCLDGSKGQPMITIMRTEGWQDRLMKKLHATIKKFS